MSPQTQVEPQVEAPRKWGFATRVAFRFCFVYFGLLCLTTQIFGALFPIPNFGLPPLADLPPMRPIVLWMAAHVFRSPSPVQVETGSGDRVYDWVLIFGLLVIAAVATVVWSALDRRRLNYVALNKWFRVFIRFSLGEQMIVYGIVKAVPLQMPFPSLARLVEPYGNFSPMGVLWYSIGASPGYETFAGCAELLGGILLLIPRTTMFGTLICLADLTQVFVLNMTYDVPVKVFSFHLILLDVFLLAPNLRRLADLFFGQREVKLASEPALFRRALGNRIAVAAQIVFGALLLAANGYRAWQGWQMYGGGRVKPVLYGIWDVEQMSVDGQVKPPLLTDRDRWRRAIFDAKERMSLQRMDNNFTGYSLAIDGKSKTLTLTKTSDKNWKATLSYDRPAKDRLTLSGDMDGHQTEMQLKLVDHTKFLLLSRGFHWVQDYPFNR